MFTAHRAYALAACAALLLLPLTACGDDSEPDPGAVANNGVGNNDPGETPPEEGHWILVDNIHSQKQSPDLHLKRNNYDYQGMHGYHRLFTHLSENGYPYHQARQGVLTDALLKPYKALFINLPDEARPRFTAEEIAVIHRFVEAGGGLFVITDHSNVYYSADILNPLLKPMGIEATYDTALERNPDYAIGSAWLKVRNLADHPINAGVRVASFQTGGTLLTDHGTAFLSDVGFGDFWNEDNPPSRVGNFSFDEGEPTGSLPVMAATSYGAGRVVVVGDQNIFGDEWLLVGQNLELASNIFAWITQSEAETPPLRERLDPSLLRVGVDLEHANWNIGFNSCAGYFPFFINFNRTPEVAARGMDQITGQEDVLIYPDIQKPVDAATLGGIEAHLARGGWVVVVAEAVRGQSASWRLVEALAPGFEVASKGVTIPVAALPATDATIPTHVGDDEFPISSPRFDVAGMKMAGHTYGNGVICPADIEQSQPYLRQVTSPSGEPLLQAEVNGETVDLARILDVGGGKLIVFLQSGFWRNETLGSERQTPTTRTADAHQIQYRFIDWMVSELK